MRLLAATCAGTFFCLSIVCVTHAQTAPTVADAGVAAPPAVPTGPETAPSSDVVAPPVAPSASPLAPSSPPVADTTAAAAPPGVDPTVPPNPSVAPGGYETPAPHSSPYAPTTYEPSPEHSSGSTGVNRRFAYGVPARSWVRRPGPGAREHEGLFARLTLGVGASQGGYRESVDGRSVQDVDTRGIALLFDAALGGRLVRNLILHASLSASSTVAVHKDVDGARYAADSIDDATGLFGAGLTYYLMPYNAYLTASLGLAVFAESRNDRESLESGSGFGGVLLLGKEWWAGPRGEWGLGLALRFSYMAAPIEIGVVESTLRASDVGIVVSATYN